MPCPINAYGRSKLAGETAIQQLACAYIILRTSWVYAARGRNFVRTILKSTHNCELQIVADQVGAPTWAHKIADATAVIITTIVRERKEGNLPPAYSIWPHPEQRAGMGLRKPFSS